jgi:hypothetical protein
MFRFNHHRQGAHYSILLQLQLLKCIGVVNSAVWLIILTIVTLARSNNALPHDGDWTENCRSCFNANFNVNFKIVFKTIRLCISWWIIKKFDMPEVLPILSTLLVQFIQCADSRVCCCDTSVQRPIHSLLNWAILLCDAIPEGKTE